MIQLISPLEKYLQTSDVIDWKHPKILELAQTIASRDQKQQDIAKACFEYVRDEIYHSVDHQMNPVTYRASDVLQYKTGYCFAKSHLLAALLRANNIAVGFCYQRLSINDEGAPYCLHGFNAIFLSELGWYRVDPRGNREGINTQFTPLQEKLAYNANLPGEMDFQNILTEPFTLIVETLKICKTWNEVLYRLPDVTLALWKQYELIARKENYIIRALTNEDNLILWTMLMYASHESSLENVQKSSYLSCYASDWGRLGDTGFIVLLDNQPIGAVWLRLWSDDSKRFGYIDNRIPELAMAVVPEHRGRGIGTQLLMLILELAQNSFPAISLNVRASSRVVDLYKRMGFIKVEGSEIVNRTGGTSFNMIFRFSK